jgi:hypothetical protein
VAEGLHQGWNPGVHVLLMDDPCGSHPGRMHIQDMYVCMYVPWQV